MTSYQHEDANFWGSCSITTSVITETMYEGLLRKDADFPGANVPNLAESWSSSDAQTYVFKLRKDVKWHDGAPFTAADVIATFDYWMRLTQPPHNDRQGVFFKQTGATWRAIDDHTVELKFKAPNATVIDRLSSCSAQMGSSVVMARNGGPQDEFALFHDPVKDVVGTGPFKFVSDDRATETVVTRNPNFWRKDASGNQLPYLDGVNILLITDAALEYAAFRTGQIDWWGNGFPVVPTSDANKLKSEIGGKITLQQGNAALIQSLYLNHLHPLIKQRDFRWAINLIIDRQEIAQRGVEGNFLPTLADPELFGPGALPLAEVNKMPGYRQPKTEDFAEARRLLAKVGVTEQTRVPLELVTRNVQTPFAASQIIVQQLKPFGIDVKLVASEYPATVPLLNAGNFAMNTDQDGIPVQEIWAHLSTRLDLSSKKDGDFQRWSDREAEAKVKKMLLDAVVILDDEKRNAILHELQRYSYTVDAPRINLGFDRTYHMWYNYVKGYKVVGGTYEGFSQATTWLDK